MIVVGFLGGDDRDRVLAQALREKGMEVLGLGNPPKELGIEGTDSLKELLHQADILIAPVSGTDGAGYIRAPFPEGNLQLENTFFRYLAEHGIPLIIGSLPDALKEMALKYGVSMAITGDMDAMAILNAIPTAEGAIYMAIGESKRSLFESRALILGLGRVGRPLARRLLALGCQVYGISRSPASLAWGQELGLTPIQYDELPSILPEIHILFNTVPSLVLPRERLRMMATDAILIDLASSPGGIDYQAAGDLGLRALLCLGLPGKMAPHTAGTILAQLYPKIINDLLEEDGLWS